MPTVTEQLNITLSREELRYLLFLLKSGDILGMDPDPLEEKMTEQQKAIAVAHAERSLRARDLVSVQPDGKVVARDMLLLMAGTCAYPEFLIAAHTFPSSGVPQRIFWNGQNGIIVSHERPAAPLHKLSFVKSREELISNMISFCNIQFMDGTSAKKIQVVNDILRKIREQTKISVQEAAKTLTGLGSSADAALDFCNLLGNEHTVTSFHAITVQLDETKKRDSVSIIAGKSATWVMRNLPEEQVEIQPINKAGLITLFQQWSVPAENWISVPESEI